MGDLPRLVCVAFRAILLWYGRLFVRGCSDSPGCRLGKVRMRTVHMLAQWTAIARTRRRLRSSRMPPASSLVVLVEPQQRRCVMLGSQRLVSKKVVQCLKKLPLTL